MTDPNKNGKYTEFKKPKRMFIDGKNVANLPSGTRGNSGRTVDVEDTVKKVEKTVRDKPSSSAIKSTYKKGKRKFKTNYKSTGSKKGKSTPRRKRKRGA